jgi:5-methylcytosine-specific restriction endonuclease McrA
MSNDVNDEEVYASFKYAQYLVVLDDEYAAFYYAREEILAAREREALLAATQPLPYAEQYRQYRQTPEWRERADAAKARFGGRCALCNASDRLEAHHRTYERVGQELPDDLTALCADCHRAYHEWRIGRMRPSSP